MSMDLTGRRALVTGAGQRVGAAIAIELARAGADVAVHYHRSRAEAEAVCAEIRALGRRAVSVAGDLLDASAPASVVAQAIAALGGLDILVASAASYESIAFEDISDEDFDRALALNTRAPFLLARHASAALREGRGSIVLVTCTSHHAPYRNHAHYIVSKGAAYTLMRVLAVELAPDVRVNAVAPGTVLPPRDLPADVLDQLVAATPLARVGSAQDVAAAVRYLACAPFVTGVEISVDGGRDLTRGVRG